MALSYANQSGAIRDNYLDPKLEVILQEAARAAGADQVIVGSGGQEAKGEGGNRTGSTRHDHGLAADIKLIKDGVPVNFNTPAGQAIFEEFSKQATARGLTGMGAATNYMGPETIHAGYGNSATWGAEGEPAPEWLRSSVAAGRAMAPIATPDIGVKPVPRPPLDVPQGVAQKPDFTIPPGPANANLVVQYALSGDAAGLAKATDDLKWAIFWGGGVGSELYQQVVNYLNGIEQTSPAISNAIKLQFDTNPSLWNSIPKEAQPALREAFQGTQIASAAPIPPSASGPKPNLRDPSAFEGTQGTMFRPGQKMPQSFSSGLAQPRLRPEAEPEAPDWGALGKALLGFAPGLPGVPMGTQVAPEKPSGRQAAVQHHIDDLGPQAWSMAAKGSLDDYVREIEDVYDETSWTPPPPKLAVPERIAQTFNYPTAPGRALVEPARAPISVGPVEKAIYGYGPSVPIAAGTSAPPAAIEAGYGPMAYLARPQSTLGSIEFAPLSAGGPNFGTPAAVPLPRLRPEAPEPVVSTPASAPVYRQSSAPSENYDVTNLSANEKAAAFGYERPADEVIASGSDPMWYLESQWLPDLNTSAYYRRGGRLRGGLAQNGVHYRRVR